MRRMLSMPHPILRSYWQWIVAGGRDNHSLLKTLLGCSCFCGWPCSHALMGRIKGLSVLAKISILVDTCLLNRCRSSISSYWVLLVCCFQENSLFLLSCPATILLKAVGVAISQVMRDVDMIPPFILSIFLQILLTYPGEHFFH